MLSCTTPDWAGGGASQRRCIETRAFKARGPVLPAVCLPPSFFPLLLHKGRIGKIPPKCLFPVVSDCVTHWSKGERTLLSYLLPWGEDWDHLFRLPRCGQNLSMGNTGLLPRLSSPDALLSSGPSHTHQLITAFLPGTPTPSIQLESRRNHPNKERSGQETWAREVFLETRWLS